MTENTFEKGLSTEFSPIKQVKGTYPYALNIVRDVQGTVKSEPGTTDIVNFRNGVYLDGSIYTLPGAEVLGSTTIDNLIYYFINSNKGSSIVEVDPKTKNAKMVLHTGILELADGDDGV